MKKDMVEVWELFMKLCEDFPELYDKYVAKIEHEMKINTPEFIITKEDKRRAWEKLRKRIGKES